MANVTASPGTLANDSSEGTTAWNNPGNAAASDDNKAGCTLVGVSTTQLLKCTNFGFSVPSDATVDGIQVSVERIGTLTRVSDEKIQLVKGGSLQGDNKASATAWPTSDGTATYGGAADKWGLTWSPSDVNASDFGVVVRAKSSNNATPGVDHVQITVTYTPAASGLTLKHMYYARMRAKS